MPGKASTNQRVLSIDPFPNGIAFAVLEGPHALIDWGIKTTRGKSRNQGPARIRDLLQHYQPDVLVFEDCAAKGSRRGPRVKRLLAAARRIARQARVRVHAVSRRQVQAALGAANKIEAAAAVAERFNELVPALPRPRKPWMSEDPRMNVFDAVGMGVVFCIGEAVPSGQIHLA